MKADCSTVPKPLPALSPNHVESITDGPKANPVAEPTKPDWKEIELKDKAVQEGAKLYVEGFKLLATIGTGSLVLMATFSDKLPKSDQGFYALRNAVMAFMVCIGCAIVLTVLSARMVMERAYLESKPSKSIWWLRNLGAFCFGSFFLALVELSFYFLNAFSMGLTK